jgi:hypothetical protein
MDTEEQAPVSQSMPLALALVYRSEGEVAVPLTSGLLGFEPQLISDRLPVSDGQLQMRRWLLVGQRRPALALGRSQATRRTSLHHNSDT